MITNEILKIIGDPSVFIDKEEKDITLRWEKDVAILTTTFSSEYIDVIYRRKKDDISFHIDGKYPDVITVLLDGVKNDE